MLRDLAIYVNTNSKYADTWPAFFGQLQKHWPTHPLVVVANDSPHPGLGWPCVKVYCDAAKRFTSQYLMGLCAVETPFVLTMLDDFFLYADVDEEHIRQEMHGLLPADGRQSCVRLIDSGRGLHYSMQASIWKTWRLKMLYASAVEDAPWDAEIAMNMRMEQGQCEILECDGPKRGNHRDSTKFPYVATALNKGKWNSQYLAELTPMLAEYGIDADKRGWTE